MTTINTAKKAASGKPGRHRVTGAPGLYLNVGASGGASWFYRYSSNGKRREMGLGALTDVSIADARRRAIELAAQRNGGLDPIETRRRERASNRVRIEIGAKRVTFALAAKSFLEAHAPSWQHRYARAAWWNPVRDYALPVIGDLLLDDIRIEHVVAVMQAAEKAGAKETARRLRARVEAVLDAAVAKGQRDATRLNPAGANLISKVHPTRRKGERAHYRAIPLEDAPAVFRQLRSRAENDTAIAAWVFMVATATRPSEALQARWSEIDFDKGLWTITAQRMKSGKAHVVPLSSIALAALKSQAVIRSGDAVFPGLRNRPLSYNAFTTAPTRAKIDAGTPHSWRSIFRDWAGDYGRVDRDLAEAALAHSLGATEASYRRRTAVEAGRPAMEGYARWLEGEDANVVPFPARA
jgi:integrase